MQKLNQKNLLFQMKYKEILKKYTHFLSTLFQKINSLFFKLLRNSKFIFLYT